MTDISKISDGTNIYNIKDTTARTGLSGKQDTLVSGTNIKTINGNSVLGNGDLSIGSSVDIDEETITQNGDNELQTVAVVNPNTNSGAISPLKIWNGTEQQWNQGEATIWYYWQTAMTELWTASTMSSSASWQSVTYGDGKFVVVTYESNKSAYSTDGINWTETMLPSSANWCSVTYGDGKFVVVAYHSNKSAYSMDGINWTASTLSSSVDWHSVAYGDSKFVAVASSNQAAYSTDGINWTASTMPSSGDWYSVTYGDGKFVAIMKGSNQAAYSTDGINWTASTMPSSGNWWSVTYGNGKFVAVIWNSAKVAYSTDGINWIESTSSSGYWRSVAYGDGKFVAVAYSSAKAAYSTDGINWTTSTMPSSAIWYSVTYGDGKFVVVANGSDASAIFTMSYDKCYTLDSIPTTSSQVYSALETTSTKTITSVGSGTITLSDTLTYNYTSSGNQNTYRTIGDAHPDWLSNIDNVGVKIGNTTIATVGPDTSNMQTTTNLVTSVSSSSTDTQYPSAKCVYDMIGNIESILHNINLGDVS